MYEDQMILKALKKDFVGAINDSITQQKLEARFPGFTCNKRLNPPDVVERNCIRFTNSNNELYEFGPPEGEIDVWKALRNPVLKKIFE